MEAVCLIKSTLGRIFASYSKDSGESFLQGEFWQYLCQLKWRLHQDLSTPLSSARAETVTLCSRWPLAEGLASKEEFFKFASNAQSPSGVD